MDGEERTVHVWLVHLVPSVPYGVYANQKSEVLSDLTLANVEALAGSGETTIECCLALWGTCKGDIKAPYVCASR